MPKKKTTTKKTQHPNSLAAIAPHAFKKGQSGNPRGKAKLTDIEKRARHASRLEIAEVYQALKGLTLEELKKVIENKDAATITILFASSFKTGIKKGDLTEVHRMYDRLLGKPKQSTELSTPEGKPIEINTTDYQNRAREIIAAQGTEQDESKKDNT